MATYQFTGSIFEITTGLPASGIKVEAMDVHRQVLGPVCVGESDAAGAVVLSVSDDTLRALFGGSAPCLYFRLVSHDGKVVGSTEKSVQWDGRSAKRARLTVDTTQPLGAATSSLYVVQGLVVDMDGAPVSGADVRVVQQVLYSSSTITELEMGEATSGARGEYVVRYNPEGEMPVLVVRVLEAAVPTATATICRATPNERADLVVGGAANAPNPGPPESVEMERKLQATQIDTGLWNLDADQIEVLACMADMPVDEVTAYVNAAKLNDARGSIARDTFYAFMKKGVGATEDEIFAHRLPALRRMIQEAAAAHVIAPSEAGETKLELTMAALETAALDALRATGGNKLRLGRVVDLATNAGITLAHRNNFLKLALNFEGTGEEFWAAVDNAPVTGDPEEPVISAVAKTHFKFMAEASALTGAHEGAVTAFYASFDAGTLGPAPLNESARGIAALTEAEIVTLLDGEYPTELYDTVAEYAAAVSAAAETRYRTARIRSRVDPESVAGEFFTAYPAFEFESSRVGPYLIEHAVDLEADEFDVQALKVELGSLERRLKVTSSYDEMVVLKDAGIESALAAHELGVDGLAQLEFDPNVAKNIAKATLIYQKSCWATGAATAMMAKYNTKLLSSSFTGLIASNLSKSEEELPKRVADWETLFGSLDQCECKHCDSVLSPAAYLVDTLEMLKKVGPPGANARDELLGRRPDLAVLGLTCDNAYTPLPYVDVVNEIMEVCVADPLLFPESPEVVQTIGTAEELAAHPDILYPALHIEAYNQLNEQVHPFVLPFNLWQEEARVYLDHLGVSRETLIEAFAQYDEDNEAALATERLRVATAQYEVMTGESAGTAGSYWNLAEPAWPNALNDVLTFMQKSGLSFAELRELLESNYCSDNDIELDGDSCDVAEMTITGLDGDSKRSMLHRLLRLRKALGFSIADTDRARVALGGEELDAPTVQKLAGLKTIVERTGVPPRVAMTWFGDMDTHRTSTDPSLFERVFLDRKSTSPSYPAFLKVFEDQVPLQPLGDVRPALTAALSVADQDLMTMVDEDVARARIGMMPLGSPFTLESELDLEVLSTLYGVASFARAIGRSIPETMVLVRLAGGTAPVRGLGSGTATPAAFLEFEKQLRRFDRTGLSVADIQYIIRDFPNGSQSLAPTDDQLDQADTELLADIAKSSTEAADISDPEGVVVSTLGAALLGNVPTSRAVSGASWLSGRATYTTTVAHGLAVGDWVSVSGISPADYNVAGQVRVVDNTTAFKLDLESDPESAGGAGAVDTSAAGEGLRRLQSILENDDLDATGLSLAFAAPFLGDVADAEDKLLSETERLGTRELRRSYVAQRFSRYVACRIATIAWASRVYDLDLDVAASLLGTAAHGAATETSILKHGSQLAVRAFIPSGSGDSWALPTLSDRSVLMRRIHKAALLIKRYSLSAADLEILYPGGTVGVTALPAVNFNELPKSGATASDERDLFEELLRLGDYAWVRSRYAGREVGLASLFAMTGDLPDYYARVAKDIGVSAVDIERLTARFIAAPHVNQFKYERLLLRLLESVEVMRRVGAPSTVILGADESKKGWRDVDAPLPSTPELPEANARALAQEIKAVARAKHTDEAWATIGKEIRDPLRDKQREALSQALVDRLELKDTNELFEELLVDVEMSPCAMTSRIVCAHGSVQTFVNRIQLNLEDDFQPSKKLAREWDWMHAYRLWEANRKVFLWPENWIEPELRDTKTPLFEELETALLQGPLDDANVEDAYRAYLDGLSDLGNLELVATHTEVVDSEHGQRDHIHVIGRTPSPYRHYHRKRTECGWGPWRRIDLDIQSDHVLPISLNGTLYLLWTQIEDEANTVSVSWGEPTPLGCTVSLGIGELRNGRWRATMGRSSPAVLDVSVNRSRLCLAGSANSDSLTVKLLMSKGVNSQKIAVSAFELARFTFWPGAGTVLVNKVAELSSDTYESETNNVTASGSSTPVAGNGRATFQYYSGPDFVPDDIIMSSQFQAWIANGSGAPTIIPLLKAPGRVVVDRQSEPVRERRDIFFDGRYGALHFKLRDLPLRSLGTSESKLVYPSEKAGLLVTKGYTVEHFYHPYVGEFRKRVALRGLPGLLGPTDGSYTSSPQWLSEPTQYLKTHDVQVASPDLEVEFMAGTAYSDYNWELFFHAPFLIANRLHQDGRFEEARKWYHVIFDPTCGWDAEEPETFYNKYAQFWKFKPFAENLDLADIQEELTGETSNSYAQAVQSWANGYPEGALSDSIRQQIAAWRADPFDPHAIARLRIVAYQKAVVQKYIENLVAWGDQLFAQSTMESVNEATQLYIHALQLLGRKPTIVSKPEPKEAESYDGLPVDAFGNPLIAIETITPPYSGAECNGSKPGLSTVYGTTYFCVPENEKLFGLWDILEDRLFKIRHCQSIDGVVRQLPLFQPPIDPALLVRAAAAGIDLDSVLNDLYVSAPPYRYAILAARAMDYASAVSGLGAAVLSALEKDDGEALAQLRAGHDVANQRLSRGIRRQQVDEARESLESVKQSLIVAQGRDAFYSSREFMSEGEVRSQYLAEKAQTETERAEFLTNAAAAIALIPLASTGGAGVASPFEVFAFGGQTLADEANLAARTFEGAARRLSFESSTTGTQASYQRRMDDWKFQAAQAKLEIAQLEKQIIAAEIRVAIAENELKLVEQQIDQVKAVEDFLRSKFTNRELYGWMKGQLAAVYQQSYDLAFKMARNAERAFQVERGDTSQTFISFGAFDGFRKGLMAGEKLSLDIRRMDAAYHTQNKREHEIVKTISIAQLNPDAFMRLRAGSDAEPADALYQAEFSLPETVFDDDFPNHHMRRIKNVNITVQCTPGPYQSVSGKLTMFKSATRMKPQDAGFVQDARIAEIATSSASNDSGMFELNFRDERYLPFEYRGLSSGAPVGDNPYGPGQWRFELLGGNEMDFESITDLVMQLRYTAREGRAASNPAVGATKRSILRRVSSAHADLWSAFKMEASDDIMLEMKEADFPKGVRRGVATNPVKRIVAYARWDDNESQTIALSGPAGWGTEIEALPFGTYVRFEFAPTSPAGAPLETDWTFEPSSPSTLQDLWIAFYYELAELA